MADVDLWDVLVGPGRTERMNVEELDASFESGAISAGTLIREPGSNDWRPLYEVAGLDPPEPTKPLPPRKADPANSVPSSSPGVVSSPPTRPESARPPESRSRPPALPPRRSGPPSKRTGRGVPLPSVPPRDHGPSHLSPKPLTPPKSSGRRVSAPPSASASPGTRSRRAPPSILSAPAPAPVSSVATSAPPPAVPLVTGAAPASHGELTSNTHAPPNVSLPVPPQPVMAVGAFEPSHAHLRQQAPPLPSDAFAHLTAPAQPLVFPLEMPAGVPAPEIPYSPAVPYSPAPQAPKPWAAPAANVPLVPSWSATPGTTDTTRGVVLEERLATSSRPSKAELSFWALVIFSASTIVLHRNGTFRHWFGDHGYTLMEAQVLGKPSLDTVAGVRAFLSETSPSPSAKAR